ncbi:MAG: hypothetical protein L0211_04080 [Planctomycetaceae bacterium]|nr:hypothetical protein [Planctomycetaceae bacterium]
MRAVISLITAIALTLHLNAGCCAHHVHAPAAAMDVAGHSNERCHEHGHEHPLQPIDAPHDDCHESHCVAIVAKAASAPEPDAATHFLPFPPSHAHAQLDCGAIERPSALAHVGSSRPLALRAHLRFCVLLN